MHLNSELGLSMTGGNKELYKKFLTDFIATNKIEVPKLEGLLYQEPNTFKRKVHTIKGQAGMLGAQRLQQLALQLEKNLTAQTLLEFSHEFSLLLEELENGDLLLQLLQPVVDEKSTLSIAVIDALFDDLELALRDSKPLVVNALMEQMHRYHISIKDEKLLNETQYLAKKYHFNSAHKLILMRKSPNY